MYKICQSEQSAKRQKELEQGLLQLMLRHNYEDISVSDLCEHMNIPEILLPLFFQQGRCPLRPDRPYPCAVF